MPNSLNHPTYFVVAVDCFVVVADYFVVGYTVVVAAAGDDVVVVVDDRVEISDYFAGNYWNGFVAGLASHQ